MGLLAAVFGQGLGQLLLQHADIGNGLAAPGLASQLQLQQGDFMADDRHARIQVGGFELQQQLVPGHDLAVAHMQVLDPGRQRRMQGGTA